MAHRCMLSWALACPCARYFWTTSPNDRWRELDTCLIRMAANHRGEGDKGSLFDDSHHPLTPPGCEPSVGHALQAHAWVAKREPKRIKRLGRMAPSGTTDGGGRRMLCAPTLLP
ncbi:hypothetical protein OH77DRAFT_884143 [Trametes cingulata]|nr:hypothetical protein OH77DRAFT_884143 [Trametes cingulata]